MSGFHKPGRYGHVPISAVCRCIHAYTIDSSNVRVEPVGVGEGGLWQIFYCTNCGGTGAVNVSCVQPLLELFDFRALGRTRELWQNPIDEPN